MAAYDFQLEQAETPKWESAEKVHDWRNHVPDSIRAIWATFSKEQREAIVVWAADLASEEHWD